MSQGCQSSPEVSPIPLSVPCLAGNEWEYVKECLDTGWVSSAGPFVSRFENEIARTLGVNHAVATSCGTAALHLALLVSGVEADQEVLVPAVTFIASANAVRYLGAWPTFLDIDSRTWQLDVTALESFLRDACHQTVDGLVNTETGRRVSAVMPVHLLGHPCDMDRILQLAEEFGLLVVEDNAEGLGSLYRGRSTGGLGKISALSFNGNKIITAGGGGMVATNEQELAERARYLSTQARDSAVEYAHSEVGYNYRLTNIASALGVAQLELLPGYLAKKRQIAERYEAAFTEVQGVEWQLEAEWAQSNRWLFAITIDPQCCPLTARELMKRLSERKIEARPLFRPLHRLTPFQDCHADKIKVADTVYERALCLPSSPNLTEMQQSRVIEEVLRLLS